MKKLLLAVWLLLLPCMALAEADFELTATVIVEESALLELPVVEAEAVLDLSEGDGVTITALGTTYCAAVCGDEAGYIATADIAFDILDGAPMVMGEVDVSPTNLEHGHISLRVKASRKSKALCRMAKGRLVLVLGEEGEMAHLAIPGYIGYGLKKYVNTDVKPEEYQLTFVDNDDPVHLRLDSRYGEQWIVMKLAPGTPVQLIRNPNGWALVEVAGHRGRMVAEYLSAKAPDEE